MTLNSFTSRFNDRFIERKFSISNLLTRSSEKSKMLVHNDHIKHIKLAMLSLAVSNQFHYTYFRTKSYTLVSCNSRKCLMCNSTSLYNREKMKYQKMVVLENWFLLWSFQCLILSYATDNLCHFPFPMTLQGFELDPIYMR